MRLSTNATSLNIRVVDDFVQGFCLSGRSPKQNITHKSSLQLGTHLVNDSIYVVVRYAMVGWEVDGSFIEPIADDIFPFFP